MNRTSPLLTLVTLLVLSPLTGVAKDKPANAPAPADPQLVKTITADKPLNLGSTIVEFVNDLIKNNTAGVQDQYNKLTAKTHEDAGGRYGVKPFQAIEWFVINHYGGPADKGVEIDHESIYIVRQELVWGVSHGFSIEANVVAKVRLKSQQNVQGEAPEVKDGWAGVGTKVTLTFEGFLNSVPVVAPPPQ